MGDQVVRAEHLSKVYRNGVEVRAVDDVSLEVSAGEVVALMGPSGAGKSTLLGLIGLLDRPSSGSVNIAGHDTSTLQERMRTRLRANLIGFVFQQFSLISFLSAGKNVELALLHRGYSRRRRRLLADKALGRVGLEHRIRHLPAQLSGGEQQRVVLARAVVANPRLVIADEPTGNLDTASSTAVVDLLQLMAAEGVAVLIATHDATVADRADRTLAIRDGTLVGEV